MGHGVAAAQLATLAVGSLRTTRRRGASLVEQAAALNTTASEHAREDQFITGLLLRADLTSGLVSIINGGHMPPLLVRDKTVTTVEVRIDPVFGVVPGIAHQVATLQLRPGDRLALITDGMMERDAAAANITALLPDLGHLHARDAVHYLTGEVLRAAGDQLSDDATVLILDWRGRPTT